MSADTLIAIYMVGFALTFAILVMGFESQGWKKFHGMKDPRAMSTIYGAVIWPAIWMMALAYILSQPPDDKDKK